MINIAVSLSVSDCKCGEENGPAKVFFFFPSFIKPSKGEEGQIQKIICQKNLHFFYP